VDWRRATFGFNSLEHNEVRLYAGCWKGQRGKFWLDGLRIEEVGLVNVLRRPGARIVVTSGETIYKEGKDFARIEDPKLNFRFDHDGPPIRILPGGRIREGQRLRVHYYHGMAIGRGQVSVCMSEPKLYEIWQKQVELIQKHLAPTHWLLSMDEIRMGGSCWACEKPREMIFNPPNEKGMLTLADEPVRRLTMAEILGGCITRQFQMIRKANPRAEVAIWSDMLDPNHNAHANYYLVEGDFTGSWRHVPKELIVATWYFRKRRASLDHFSKLGFRTLAGAYYDGDTLDNPKGWLDDLDTTPKAVGIMYTTWRNKYALLAPFGDLVSKR
ncbi:hypothetical protein ACFL09_03080, partial [Planctomycetota bacterium]